MNSARRAVLGTSAACAVVGAATVNPTIAHAFLPGLIVRAATVALRGLFLAVPAFVGAVTTTATRSAVARSVATAAARNPANWKSAANAARAALSTRARHARFVPRGAAGVAAGSGLVIFAETALAVDTGLSILELLGTTQPPPEAALPAVQQDQVTVHVSAKNSSSAVQAGLFSVWIGHEDLLTGERSWLLTSYLGQGALMPGQQFERTHTVSLRGLPPGRYWCAGDVSDPSTGESLPAFRWASPAEFFIAA